jgi:hypothetical protein
VRVPCVVSVVGIVIAVPVGTTSPTAVSAAWFKADGLIRRYQRGCSEARRTEVSALSVT